MLIMDSFETVSACIIQYYINRIFPLLKCHERNSVFGRYFDIDCVYMYSFSLAPSRPLVSRRSSSSICANCTHTHTLLSFSLFTSLQLVCSFFPVLNFMTTAQLHGAHLCHRLCSSALHIRSHMIWNVYGLIVPQLVFGHTIKYILLQTE